MKFVLVRWKIRGCLNVNGRSYSRKPGEEDVIKIGHAKSLEACGIVEVVGESGDVAVVAGLPDTKELKPVGVSETPNSGSIGPTEAVYEKGDGKTDEKGKVIFSDPL